MARSILSKAKERAKDASIAETMGIMPGSALSRPRARAKAKAKARAKLTTDCAITVASLVTSPEIVRVSQKAKEKGKQ